MSDTEEDQNVWAARLITDTLASLATIENPIVREIKAEKCWKILEQHGVARPGDKGGGEG